MGNLEGMWVLLRQGEEALIVKPYLVDAVANQVEVQYVFGSGGQSAHGDRHSVHDTLDAALAALHDGRRRVEGSLVIHSEGEVQISTHAFRH